MVAANGVMARALRRGGRSGLQRVVRFGSVDGLWRWQRCTDDATGCAEFRGADNFWWRSGGRT